MSYAEFERKVLERPGAAERVDELERRMLIAHGLRDARVSARVSQKELARRLGVSQPRVAAIERAEDINLSTLARYAAAIGGEPMVEIVIGDRHVPLLGGKLSERLASA